jgi:hypothetical protein
MHLKVHKQKNGSILAIRRPRKCDGRVRGLLNPYTAGCGGTCLESQPLGSGDRRIVVQGYLGKS